MADRDYYNDRERSRGYEESRGDFGRDRDRQIESNWSDRNRDTGDRGPMSRGADEVRSWFGDDEARRRREMDEYRDRSMEPRSRYEERGRSGSSDRSWSGGGDWRREPDYWSPSSSYGSSPSRGSMTGQGSSYYGSGSRSDYGRTSGAFSGSSGYTGSGYSSEGWGGSSMGRSSGYGESYRSGSFMGSGSFAGRGPRNYQRSDERIREEVNERLTDDPRVDASDIDVEVRNGEVFLRGRVDERRDKRAAEEIVENLPGVKDVRNELRVERSSGLFGGSDRDRQQGDRNRQEKPRPHG